MRSSIALAMSGLAARWATLARDLLLILAGSFLAGLSAQVAVYLPFTPVPISGQTFAFLLIGATLGSRRGALSLLTYVAQGAAGLPVFAGGLAGLAVLLGPRGGYLLGMIAGAYVVGWLAERGWDRRVLRPALAMVLASAVMYAIAVPWLAVALGQNLGAALALGFAPFIIGDSLKIALAVGGIPVVRGLISRLP